MYTVELNVIHNPEPKGLTDAEREAVHERSLVHLYEAAIAEDVPLPTCGITTLRGLPTDAEWVICIKVCGQNLYLYKDFNVLHIPEVNTFLKYHG